MCLLNPLLPSVLRNTMALTTIMHVSCSCSAKGVPLYQAPRTREVQDAVLLALQALHKHGVLI